jgi:hypothetical protein
MRFRHMVAVVSCLALSSLACSRSAPAPSPAAEHAGSPTGEADSATESWTLAQGKIDGHPAIVRIRADLARMAGDPAYPHRVEIAADFIRPLDDGMPQPDDARAIGPIEDEIVSQFDMQHDGWLAAVITSNGARTFILMSKRADVDAKLAAVKAHAAGRPIHLRVESDPTWARFRALNVH